MPREIYLRPGEDIKVIASPRLPTRPLLTEEERKVQLAKRRALAHARDAARQLALPIEHLQGGDPDLQSVFSADYDKRLSKLGAELHQRGITADELVADITRTYKQAQHPPSHEQAYDLARRFVSSIPGYAEHGEEEVMFPDP